MAYWKGVARDDVYVYGRVMKKRSDLVHALLWLRHDFGVDPHDLAPDVFTDDLPDLPEVNSTDLPESRAWFLATRDRVMEIVGLWQRDDYRSDGPPDVTAYAAPPCVPCRAAAVGGEAAMDVDASGDVFAAAVAAACDCCFVPECPNCDDGNPCTRDYCEVGCGFTYCVHESRNCNDGMRCTYDSCNYWTGGCEHRVRNCNDGDPCTYDSCNPSTGSCTHPSICPGGTCCRDGWSAFCCWNGNSCCANPEHCCGGSCCGAGCCGPGESCCNAELLLCCAVGDLCCGDHCCPGESANTAKGKASCCGDGCCPTGTDCCNPELQLCCPVGLCCGDHCCPAELPICCGSGCCPATEYCCNTDLVVCCESPSPAGGAVAATAGEECCVDRCCATDWACCGGTTCCPAGNCCVDQCCQTGWTCCGGTTCCPAANCCPNDVCCNQACEVCVSNGSLSGGTITVQPEVACIGDTITFTVSGVVDSRGRKRVRCTSYQSIPPVAPSFWWYVTRPNGSLVWGSGAVATVVATLPGVYTCTFYAYASRECPPAWITIGPATAQTPDVVSVEWQTHPTNPALDGCPNNGGRRIFPDKISALDGAAA